MATYGTTENVATRLGRTFTPKQSAQCEYVLQQIELMIEEKLGPIEILESKGIRLSAVASVCVEAAWRVMLNPGAKDNEKIDDYSYGLDDSVTSGGWYLSEAEWDRITPAVNNTSGSFSVRAKYQPGWAGKDYYGGQL